MAGRKASSFQGACLPAAMPPDANMPERVLLPSLAMPTRDTHTHTQNEDTVTSPAVTAHYAEWRNDEGLPACLAATALPVLLSSLLPPSACLMEETAALSPSMPLRERLNEMPETEMQHTDRE